MAVTGLKGHLDGPTHAANQRDAESLARIIEWHWWFPVPMGHSLLHSRRGGRLCLPGGSEREAGERGARGGSQVWGSEMGKELLVSIKGLLQ